MPEHKYGVHEIFGPTIQGEGELAGTPCLFLRFSGCNMWDGRPETREDSKCPYCDTDFFSHTMMTSLEIGVELAHRKSGVNWLWISGGEPMLQLDAPLLDEVTTLGFQVGVETNGTVELKPGVRRRISHLVVSPKLPWDQTKVQEADCLKLLYPHPNPKITPEAFSSFSARARFLQPIWPDKVERYMSDEMNEEDHQMSIRVATEKTICKVMELPGWRLSTQTHKYIGVV